MINVDLLQRYTTKVLWHFVGSNKKTIDEQYAIMESILKTQTLTVGAVEEPMKYFLPGFDGQQEAYGHPVNCLADIPFKDLYLHSERYGLTAIGFHRDSAVSCGFNPVLYINQHSSFFTDAMKCRDDLFEKINGIDSALENKFEEFFKLLGSITKSGDIKGDLVNSPGHDYFQINNYYYEREWRSIEEWNFLKKDVALILAPDEKINNYRELLNNLDNFKDIPLLPFSLVSKM